MTASLLTESDEKRYDWIYVIGTKGDNGPKNIKIGRTTSKLGGHGRIAGLKTGSLGYKLKVLYQESVENSKSIESRLHMMLKDYRLEGEWFKRCPDTQHFLDMVQEHGCTYTLENWSPPPSPPPFPRAPPPPKPTDIYPYPDLHHLRVNHRRYDEEEAIYLTENLKQQAVADHYGWHYSRVSKHLLDGKERIWGRNKLIREAEEWAARNPLP